MDDSNADRIRTLEERVATLEYLVQMQATQIEILAEGHQAHHTALECMEQRYQQDAAEASALRN